jgi:GT2 family glycosyltransferase
MNDIDVILVRYCTNNEDAELWNNTLTQLNQYPINVLTYDNTDHNIGLTKARIVLAQQSKAPYLIFMDFDFHEIHINFTALVDYLNMPQVGMTVPYSKQLSTLKPYTEGEHPVKHWEWQEIRRIPCNCMAIKRTVYDEIGGFYEGYHTSQADVELVRRLWQRGLKVMQHNRSSVIHIGRSSAHPDKRSIWDADRRVFEERRSLFQCRRNSR